MSTTTFATPLETDGLVVCDLYEDTAPAVARSPAMATAAASLLVGTLLDLVGVNVVLSVCLAALSFPVILGVARKRFAEEVGSRTVAIGEARLREFLLAPPVMMDLAPIAAIGRKGTVLSGAAYDGSWFYMIDDGIAARIPLRLIRDWACKIEGHTSNRVYAAGGLEHMGRATLMQIQANRDNGAAEAAAWRASGLIVQVADVERPSWHFITRDRSVLDRWNEILTQLKEGRLVAH